jgi:4-hydroxyphenylpyruvate dioxygenase-like putative hemolysin
VVINSEITSATPQLVAVGLDFDSKSQVMDRMRGLQYGLIARDVAHGESDFGLVCAPNGINFHILESSDGKPQWTNDFAATTEAQPGDSAIIGIDHVAIREASQHADESTLFLRSALGLELQAELGLEAQTIHLAVFDSRLMLRQNWAILPKARTTSPSHPRIFSRRQVLPSATA